MNLKKSTLRSAISSVHKAVDAKQWTKKTLKAARGAAGTVMEANKVPEHQIKKQFQHREIDTTRTHYTNSPPVASMMALGGWRSDGNDYDVIRSLARVELLTDFKDLVDAIVPHSAGAQQYVDDPNTNVDWTTRCHVSLLREASASCIESVYVCVRRIEHTLNYAHTFR
jgi:hypothetical protein